jgi:uncharacterized protein
VAYIKKYTINFRALETGTYHFTFEIEDRFFACFKKSEIQRGLLFAEVELVKEERLATLNIEINGEVSVLCDRCLEDLMYPLHFSGSLYIKEEEEIAEKSEKVIKIEAEESHINLAQYFYESIHLSLPLKRTHPEDEKGNSTCNQEMIDRIRQHQQRGDRHTIDPRWEKLKNIHVKRN